MHARLIASVMAFVLAASAAAQTPQSFPIINAATGADFYLKRGEEFATVHDYDRAIADYTAAIQLNPKYAEAFNDRGFAHYLKGNDERAIADYTRAIELRPDSPMRD